MEERAARAQRRHPIWASPPMPRPAASVVLLRRGGKHGERELEVLLLKRTEEAKFMPGVWVFPGGAVDPGDGEGEAGYRACAVRELAEEAGIELAAERGAGAVLALDHPRGGLDAASTPGSSSPSPRPTRRPSRTGSRPPRRGWFEPAGGAGGAGGRRAGARLPDDQPARVAAARSAPPTRRSRPTASRTVEPILPKVIGDREDHRVVLPGDPDYPAPDAERASSGNGSRPACQGPGG